MSGYTKLFNKILTSSIWSESSDTRVLWITMLAAADKDGIVLGTPSGLARLAGVAREQCLISLGIFLGPDCEGSQDYQGRRITAVEGGYRLLNHGKYRELLTKADQNEKAKIRMRHIREQMRTNANTANCYAGVRDVRQASTEASTTTEAEAVSQKHSARKARTAHFAIPSLGEVKAYCQERNNRVDAQQWFNHYTSNGWKVGRNSMKDWRAAIRTWETNGHGTDRQVVQSKPADNAAVRRFHNNRARLEEAFPELARAAAANGSGHEAGLGAGADRILEAGTPDLQRPGDH